MAPQTRGATSPANPEAGRFTGGLGTLTPGAAAAAVDVLGCRPLVELGRCFDRAGIEAFLVGGGVLDVLDGRAVRDLDVAAGAPIEVLTRVLATVGTVIDTGSEFGTVTVVIDDGDERVPVEVTRFRAETYTSDSRNPTVEAVEDPVEDFARRDFTVNAIGLRLGADIDDRLFDPFDGVGDLERRILRSVGDAADRFSEDPLRIIRFFRIAATKNFDLDPVTAAAVPVVAGRLSIIARERMTAEARKLLAGPAGRFRFGIEAAVAAGVADNWFAGFAVDELGVRADVTSPIARLAAVAATGSQFQRGLAALTFGRTEITEASAALAVVDAVFGGDVVAVRDAVAKASVDVCAAAREICVVDGTCVGLLDDAESIREILVAGPAVTGNDLIEAGFKPGPEFGKRLGAARACFLADPTVSREELLAVATA